MEAYEIQFLKSLVITVSIELTVLIILFKTIYKKYPVDIRDIVFAGILASSLTLPYLWFILPYFIKSKIPYILTGEISVVLVESIIFFLILKIKYLNSLIISFICNLISFLSGLIIR